MKIKPQDQTKLESLLEKQAQSYGHENLQAYVSNFRQAVDAGKIKIINCAATRCFCNILNGDPLSFVCKTIYSYADDSHLKTFWKKLYKKY